ncbi:purine-cytosine permease family protein [Mycobacterium sp. ML4]
MQRLAAETTDASELGNTASTAQTLEDYTLRFAPRHYRRWSPAVVGISALGGIAYLADFAIGANVGITCGTGNALWGIGIFAMVVLASGFPLAYYAARYNIDLDLITRGSGFGYYGSVVTNVIFATFTFIFFALEGSIMAQGLQLGLHVPLWLGYASSTLLIFPLVMYGMKVLSQLQLWTTPLWLALMVAPFAYLVLSHPDSIGQFLAYPGSRGGGGVNLGSALLAAGVCLSLIAQIAEQIDYLRFMPPRTPENSRRWWTWTVLAGPGWVVFGAIKQIIGLFLAVYLISHVAGATDIANVPVHQFTQIYRNFMPGWLALTLAVILVVISQIKINVTNAYSGSLAWTNSFTRVTKHYPGRVLFLGVNLGIALILMEANMFDFLNTILGGYANCGIAWVVTVASDIAFNKYLLGLSPRSPEFRRGMLYAVNPVGFGSMLLAAGLSIIAFFGGLGESLRPYSPLVAIAIALVMPPILAICTRGKYYLRRTDDGIDLPSYDEHGNPSDEQLNCHVCFHDYERPDMMACQKHDAFICSLCLSTDSAAVHVMPASR